MTATGASCCFMLSKIFGRSILFHYFPVKLKKLEEKVRSAVYLFIVLAKMKSCLNLLICFWSDDLLLMLPFEVML